MLVPCLSVSSHLALPTSSADIHHPGTGAFSYLFSVSGLIVIVTHSPGTCSARSASNDLRISLRSRRTELITVGFSDFMCRRVRLMTAAPNQVLHSWVKCADELQVVDEARSINGKSTIMRGLPAAA